VSFIFLVAFTLNFGAPNWANLADLFAMRITVGNAVIFAGYIAFCSAIFSGCGFYRSHRFSRLSWRSREMLLAITIIAGIVFLLRGPLDLSFATNRFLFFFGLLNFVFLMLSHEAAFQLLHFARLRGRNLRNVVIVGERQEANSLAERIQGDSTLGYRIIEIIDPGGATE
jgi:FlaA1/EpsC-like NDP-sugar epimerase